MKKERINEIKKGLENDIYSKIKDIEVEKREDTSKFNKFSEDYVSTDFLADILPHKEEISDTIQILDKNSVDLELDNDEVFKKYDEYIYKESVEKTTAKLDVKKEESVNVPSLNNKQMLNVEEPNIPPFQTEEHLERIEADLQTVELKYIEEEKQNLEEMSKKLFEYEERLKREEEKLKEDQRLEEERLKQIRLEEEHLKRLKQKEELNLIDEDQPLEEDNLKVVEEEGFKEENYLRDDETIIAPKIMFSDEEDFKEDLEKIKNLDNVGQEYLELVDDFQDEDQILVPDVDEIEKVEISPIEDSQFIFEQDIEEDNEELVGQEFGIMEERFGNQEENLTYIEQENPLGDNALEDLNQENSEEFWEEEEVTERKYVDLILFIIVVILILTIIYMIV